MRFVTGKYCLHFCQDATTEVYVNNLICVIDQNLVLTDFCSSSVTYHFAYCHTKSRIGIDDFYFLFRSCYW